MVFYLCLNKRLSKQARDWWFETPWRSLWCRCNDGISRYLIGLVFTEYFGFRATTGVTFWLLTIWRLMWFRSSCDSIQYYCCKLSSKQLCEYDAIRYYFLSHSTFLQCLCSGCIALKSPSYLKGPTCAGGGIFRSTIRSVKWLMIPWLLAAPSHQPVWQWACKIDKSLSLVRENPTICDITMWRNYKAHWSRDKMADILQMTFSNAFSCRKIISFRFTFHWCVCPTVQSTLTQHWFG